VSYLELAKAVQARLASQKSRGREDAANEAREEAISPLVADPPSSPPSVLDDPATDFGATLRAFQDRTRVIRAELRVSPGEATRLACEELERGWRLTPWGTVDWTFETTMPIEAFGELPPCH
jgi:hypothetical protein